jgi:hypothetical protein
MVTRWQHHDAVDLPKFLLNVPTKLRCKARSLVDLVYRKNERYDRCRAIAERLHDAKGAESKGVSLPK